MINFQYLSSGCKFHLMVVELPKGLPIPNVSSSSNTILEWNAHSPSHIGSLFEITNINFLEEACMLVFLSWSKIS